MDKKKLIEDLLASISGVLIFLSLAYWIDLNGLTVFSMPILILGIVMLFWSDPFIKLLKPLGFLTKPTILTISHILIFIGLKTCLNGFIENYWVILLIIGIILLNKNQQIAQKIIPTQKK